jgi:hypothetical protein
MKLKDLINKFGEYEVPQELIDKFELLEKSKSKTIWNLAHNDLYNWINGEGDICSHHWCEDEIDLNIRKAGNAFLTYKEATKEKERREVETLLLKYGGRRWFKNREYNYFLRADDNLSDNIWIDEIRVWVVQGVIYFDTKEQAQIAISEIGAERIKNALFEVR